MEREKLETKLEEERKSRDQWIKEQQMKMESLSGNCERHTSQVCISMTSFYFYSHGIFRFHQCLID